MHPVQTTNRRSAIAVVLLLLAAVLAGSAPSGCASTPRCPQCGYCEDDESGTVLMDPSRWTDDPEDDFGMQWTSPRIPREGREPCDIRISIDPPFLPPELHPYDFKPRHQALFNKDGSFVLVLTVPMGRNLGGAKGARQQWAEWTRGPYEIRWRAVPKPGP